MGQQRKSKSNSLNRPKIVDKVREINHSYYKKQREVTLVSDPPRIPAQGIESKSTKSKGGANWNLDKRERFTTDHKEEFTNEEKEKALSEMASNKRRVVHPSAVFISRSMKSHLETQIYQTNNSFKAELRKIINFKDEKPGPGTYQVGNNMTEKIHPVFQFFGSTV